MAISEFDGDYEQEDFFGEPYKELVDFFRKYPTRGAVLDMGCGQGRDSIALAKLGYKVTGVDISQVGIFQMLRKARKLKLKLTGVVHDIFTFEPSRKYDVILLDSVLLFRKKDQEKETIFLTRVLEYVKQGGLICIFIHKRRPTEKLLTSIMNPGEWIWEKVVNRYIDFEWEDKRTGEREIMKYKMVLAKKIGR